MIRTTTTRRLAVVAGIVLAARGLPLPAQTAVNVFQHHNHSTRDGVYIDPAFTPTAAAALKRDTNFNGSISGHAYAQPLYIEGGPGGKAMVIAVTESNNVYALDAADGTVIWQRNVGVPVSLSSLPCGNISPLGITGTPIVDLPSRALLFDAMTTPDGGTTKRHLIYSLNVDTGAINSGWPVNVNGTATSGTNVFDSFVQNQRGALAVLSNVVYVPYGGHGGDCGDFHGWVVGVPLSSPASVSAWAVPLQGGGIWAVSGPSTDGTNLFVATGNTFGATTWNGGEALIRLHPGPAFSGLASDYWAPSNWITLDNNDTDIGSAGALLIDVPGATPSQLVAALGKDGNAYLANRTNLGGIGTPVAQSHVSSTAIKVAPATYRTSQGTYVVLCDDNDFNNTLISFRISAANPPAISTVWTAAQHGHGSPFVTSTDGTNNFIVWGIGSEGDQRLRAFDGDTGATIYSGGGANELMSGTHRFNTGIVARGRIFLANDNRVYAFTVPVAPSIVTQPTNQTVDAGSNASFSVVASGSAPLNYQWFFNTTNRLSGATTNVVSLPNAQATNAGSYSVVVTNSVGSVTSAVAVLTVLVPPSIVTQPTNQTVDAGSNASFSVVASGSAPLSYQWFFNATNQLAGAMTNLVSLANVQPTNAGSYSVVVTNSAGSVTSALAVLTVTQARLVEPGIVTQPTNQTVAAGANASFSVVAAGSAPLSYQWFFNATNGLAGATTNALNLPNAHPHDAGSYSVVVTNEVGSVTSDVAILSVVVPPILLVNPTALPGGSFQLSFTNVSGLNFTVFGSTDVTLPLTSWTVLGAATEGPSGHFQFTDPQATNYSQRYYRVRSP
jgi:uncharacterized protein YpmS